MSCPACEEKDKAIATLTRIAKLEADVYRQSVEKNARLRKALEFYAGHDIYIYGTEMRRAGGILVDGGDTAKEALAADREV